MESSSIVHPIDMFKQFLSLIVICTISCSTINAQNLPSKVDFDAFMKVASEVEEYRKNRLVSLQNFKKMASEPNTIILDTRSKAMYEQKHVKGAVHLNFSDFTQENLAKIIPNNQVRILIYCNNNFYNEPDFFATKSFVPLEVSAEKEITLALNIPTFINLYAYGYKNVYELKDLIDARSDQLTYGGLSE